MPTEIAIGGKTLKNVKARGKDKPAYGNIYLLTPDEASRLFLPERERTPLPYEPPTIAKTAEAGSPRKITIGVNKAAESPSDKDFDNAGVYRISGLPAGGEREKRLLKIAYRGDEARLYCNGKLIADNFYNGRPMLMGLWRLPEDATELELRILPLQEDMPVYFPAEADTAPGEEVIGLEILESEL